jgi:hypothetical protein
MQDICCITGVDGSVSKVCSAASADTPGVICLHEKHTGTSCSDLLAVQGIAWCTHIMI